MVQKCDNALMERKRVTPMTVLITEASCCCWSLTKCSLLSYWTECLNIQGLPSTCSRLALCKTGQPLIRSQHYGCLLRSTENSRKIITFTLPLSTLRQHSTQLINLHCGSFCGQLKCHIWLLICLPSSKMVQTVVAGWMAKTLTLVPCHYRCVTRLHGHTRIVWLCDQQPVESNELSTQSVTWGIPTCWPGVCRWCHIVCCISDRYVINTPNLQWGSFLSWA